MADWNLPTLTDLYQDFLNLLKARDDDLAKMFDGTTSSNLPVGTIRWSDANARFEKWDGTAWTELTTKYLINVDTVDGIHASATPTANNLLPLDASGSLPADITGDADTVDGFNASPGSAVTERKNSLLATDGNGQLNIYSSLSTPLGCYSTSWVGIYGQSDTSFGIYGSSSSNLGAYGYSDTSIGLKGRSRDDKGVLGEGATYDFYANGSGVNYGPFTGAHDGLIKDPDIELGDIVVDVRLVRSSNISNAIFEVAPSSQKAQKTAVGVCVFTSDLNERNIPAALLDQDAERDEDGQLPPVQGFEQIAAEYDLISFNALGEGHINVCGEGGDIEAGDYICTSSMPGKGMRQDDDLYHNYTVARARAPVTFDSPDEVKQVPCIYLCG
ncbi:MAG TPA: hypothetical protein ENK05_11735 [Gammaproteobacteria bacterium]|nr:hypothetical protein [Gammaproteobacteria bacterium]